MKGGKKFLLNPVGAKAEFASLAVLQSEQNEEIQRQDRSGNTGEEGQ